MKLRKPDPNTIKVPEVRVTAEFDEDLLKQFRASIKEAGQVAPIICCQVGEELVLVDGLHRLEEAKKSGAPSIDAIILPGDMVEVLTKNIFLDHLRGKTPVSQMVKVIKTLYEDYKLEIADIEKKTGLTQGYIEKLIKISQASIAVQDALDQGVIGVGHAFELARLPYAIQQEEVIAKHQVWRFTIKELHDQVDAVLGAMQEIAELPAEEGPKAPPRKVEYHCEGCKEVVEPRYLRPVMVCPECFGELWRLAKAREPVPVKVEKEGEGD